MTEPIRRRDARLRTYEWDDPAVSGAASRELGGAEFLRAITAATGRLICEGTVAHLGARTALAQARLTGEDDKLYAQATSSCLIFRP